MPSERKYGTERFGPHWLEPERHQFTTQSPHHSATLHSDTISFLAKLSLYNYKGIGKFKIMQYKYHLSERTKAGFRHSVLGLRCSIRDCPSSFPSHGSMVAQAALTKSPSCGVFLTLHLATTFTQVTNASDLAAMALSALPAGSTPAVPSVTQSDWCSVCSPLRSPLLVRPNTRGFNVQTPSMSIFSVMPPSPRKCRHLWGTQGNPHCWSVRPYNGHIRPSFDGLIRGVTVPYTVP